MTDLINIFARSIKDLTLLPQLPDDLTVLDPVKIPVGNLPVGVNGCEALSIQQLRILVYSTLNQDIRDIEQKVDSKLSENKTYTNQALSQLSTAANKFYPTLAEANADIANIAVNQPITIGEVTNGGLWYKASSSATSLTKSPYDALKQSKDYTDKSIESQNISYINDDNSKFNFVNKYQYDYDARYVNLNDANWNAIAPFELKKNQTILYSVFTPTHTSPLEMGNLVVFDTNGVFKKTLIGTNKGVDTSKRVTSSYTATEDCLIGIQSVHNLDEGYDGLEDYVVIKDVILREDLRNLYANIITGDYDILKFTNKYQYDYDARYVNLNDANWNAIAPFELKKNQTILYSVFTPTHTSPLEMGNLVVFDTNGVFKKTLIGTNKGVDTSKRVTSSYTATEDCLIGIQSVHNLDEGYDGLEDYVILTGTGVNLEKNSQIEEYVNDKISKSENTTSVRWMEEEGFLISYFGENDVGQNLLLAYSKDGVNFKQFLKYVPDNQHTIRDPSIIYKNGWWYVAHTNVPYGQMASAERFNIIKSRDLVHWYNVARLGFDGYMNWAPEFFIDYNDDIYLIVSCNKTGNFQPYIYKATSNDLSAWSEGILITGEFNSDGWIDYFMFKVDYEYYIICKQERDDTKWLSIFKSSSPIGGFNTIVKDGSLSWAAISQKVEAPCVIKLDNGNYRIYADGLPEYQGGLGQFLMYQDFDSSFNPISSDITKITSDSPMRHGTVLRVKGIQKYLSQSEFVAENVSDSAVPTNIESVLEEMREIKNSLIKAGLMKLS